MSDEQEQGDAEAHVREFALAALLSPVVRVQCFECNGPYCKRCGGKLVITDPVRAEAIDIARGIPDLSREAFDGAMLGAEHVLRQMLKVSLPKIDKAQFWEKIRQSVERERDHVGRERFDTADAVEGARRVVDPVVDSLLEALRCALVRQNSASEAAHRFAVDNAALRDAARRQKP